MYLMLYCYHQLVVAQLHAVSTDSPVVVFGQIGKNDLQSRSLFVKVSCNLVSLFLVVGSDGTNEDGHTWAESLGEVPSLQKHKHLL